MITAAIVGAMAFAFVLLDRRRRRHVERFAELAGVRRMPGESTEALLSRAAGRFRLRG